MRKLLSKALSFYRRARLGRIPGVSATIYFGFRVVSRILPRLIDINGSKMYVDFGEADFFIEAVVNLYEPFTTEIFKKVVKEGDTVVDLGANVGYYSLLSSKLVGQRGKVYAFEPHPKSHDLLNKNIEVNKYNNIVPVPKAVTNRVGTTKFFLSSRWYSGTFYQERGRERFIEVQTETLDHFFQDKDDTIDVIKMDIEGGEMDAILGMDTLIRRNENLKMFIEFSPVHLKSLGFTSKEFLDKLQSYNFSTFIIDEREKRLKCANNVNELMASCEHLDVVNLFVTSVKLDSSSLFNHL
jgi:FkbM family methyltransferase